MTRRLLASYLALTIVVLAALEVPLAIVNARNERQDLKAKLEREPRAHSRPEQRYGKQHASVRSTREQQHSEREDRNWRRHAEAR